MCDIRLQAEPLLAFLEHTVEYRIAGKHEHANWGLLHLIGHACRCYKWGSKQVLRHCLNDVTDNIYSNMFGNFPGVWQWQQIFE